MKQLLFHVTQLNATNRVVIVLVPDTSDARQIAKRRAFEKLGGDPDTYCG